MKMFIHTLKIGEQESKTYFQIQLPRNAKSIWGIMAHLRNTETYGNLSRFAPDERHAGTLYLSVTGEQNVFFAQDFTVQLPNHNYELLPPVQKFFFKSGEAFIHGTRDHFFSLNVPLRSPLIEGYYENKIPNLSSGSYELAIYFKIKLL